MQISRDKNERAEGVFITKFLYWFLERYKVQKNWIGNPIIG
jgi:hypothetical protein